ncbi:MAG: hypothetical protein M0C28_23890 [Candidatus Moduliflexus flocculans]|nr:hypothetical protein [Candidatus Moduliflexus flocculans]
MFRAACRQAGVILAETIEEYYDLVRTFALLAGQPPAGNRVAGVVNAGLRVARWAPTSSRGLTQARLAPDDRRAAQRDQPLRGSWTPPRRSSTSRPWRTIGMYARVRGGHPPATTASTASSSPWCPHAVTLKTVPGDLPRPRQPRQPAPRPLRASTRSPWSCR